MDIASTMQLKCARILAVAVVSALLSVLLAGFAQPASAQEAGSTPESAIPVELKTNVFASPELQTNVWYEISIIEGDGAANGLISLAAGDWSIEMVGQERQGLVQLDLEPWPARDSQHHGCFVQMTDGDRDVHDCNNAFGGVTGPGGFMFSASTWSDSGATIKFQILGEAGPSLGLGNVPSSDVVTPSEDVQPQAGVLVILDASGSMLRASGTSDRITEAKAAAQALFDQIQPTDRVGLRVYGHRVPSADKANACVDSELVVPVTAGSVATMRAVVDGVVALGETPIGYSLEQVRGDLGELGGRVVLVSDGIDECFPDLGPDPCDVAVALIADGFEIVIDTIGFAAGDEAGNQLQCIADATGGTYRSASDGAALRSALGELGEAAALEVRGFDVTGGEIASSGDPRGAQRILSGTTYRAIASPEQNSMFFRMQVPENAASVEVFVQVEAAPSDTNASGNVKPSVLAGRSDDICRDAIGVSTVRSSALWKATSSMTCEMPTYAAGWGGLDLLRFGLDWPDNQVTPAVPIEFRYVVRDLDGNVLPSSPTTSPMVDALYDGENPTTGFASRAGTGHWRSANGTASDRIAVNAGDVVFVSAIGSNESSGTIDLDTEDPAGFTGDCSQNGFMSFASYRGPRFESIQCTVEETGDFIATATGGQFDFGLVVLPSGLSQDALAAGESDSSDDTAEADGAIEDDNATGSDSAEATGSSDSTEAPTVEAPETDGGSSSAEPTEPESGKQAPADQGEEILETVQSVDPAQPVGDGEVAGGAELRLEADGNSTSGLVLGGLLVAGALGLGGVGVMVARKPS